MNSLPQARGIFLRPQDVDIVGKLAIIAQQRLQIVLQLVLEVLERRVVAIASAALAGLETGKSIKRHCRCGLEGRAERKETSAKEMGRLISVRVDICAA